MPGTERAENLAARARASAEFKRSFPRTINSWRASLDLGAIEAAGLDAIAVAPAMDFSVLSDAVQADVDQLVRAGLREGAALGPQFSPSGITARPGSLQLVTEEFAATRTASLVNLIDSDAREGLRETIASAIRGDIPRKDAALLIGNQAGLTRRQVISVNNFADLVARDFVIGDAVLSDAALNRFNQQVNAFESRILSHRGAVIAQTETQRAINAGERAFWESALDGDDTTLVRQDVVKIWHRVGSNVCPICLGISNEPVAFDTFFQSITGWLGQHPPAHPLCKCYVEYRVQQP